MSTSLILHRGARPATFAELGAVETPAATLTWHPIPHQRLAALVKQGLEAHGLQVRNEQYGLYGTHGQRLFGTLELAPDKAIGERDYTVAIGLRNSHDQTFPAGVAMGSRVFVCDNLAFSGEVQFGRKHTSQIMRDLPGLVSKAVAQLVSKRFDQARRIEVYKVTPVSDAVAHDSFIRMIDRGILPVTRLPEALKEWRTPSHPEFRDRTAWSLFNAVTEVLKTGQQALPERTIKLHGLVDSITGLAIGQGPRSN